jgi:transposase
MATDGATQLTSPGDELTRLRQENERLRDTLREANVRVTHASSEVELLRAERLQWLEAQQQKDRLIDGLQHQLQQLLQRLYGRSSEKIDKNQLMLFETLLDQLAPRTPGEQEPPPADDASAPKNNGRKGRGRTRIPAGLPREKVLYDLPEDQKPCPCCGKLRHVIGRQVSEQLEYVPARIKVLEHVQLTYACRDCERNAAESGAQVVTAAKPASPIEKCLAAPGLLAHVIVSKYGDHLPLYRLERIFERLGLSIARSTMCAWMAQCAEALRPLYDRMKGLALQSKVIHTDDTPVEVLEPGRGETRTGRFWVYLGDPEHAFTVFEYTPNRRRDGPMTFLSGWGKDRRVYLQADAFGGYDGIYAGKAGGQVTEVACWAHARRKFYDARRTDAEVSTHALAYIRLLYDVEDRAKRCSAAERQQLRRECALPRLEQFKDWLTSQQAERGGPVLPKSPMGEAIGYALNQWDALCVYTTDGDLAIDNNASENAVRPIALGRKNWLFAGSDNGGATAATLFSLLATCQRHKVEPFAYLRDVLTRIAETPREQYDQLLPNRWKPAAGAT